MKPAPDPHEDETNLAEDAAVAGPHQQNYSCLKMGLFWLVMT